MANGGWWISDCSGLSGRSEVSGVQPAICHSQLNEEVS